jgi:hypothetical protein
MEATISLICSAEIGFSATLQVALEAALVLSYITKTNYSVMTVASSGARFDKISGPAMQQQDAQLGLAFD